MFSLEAALQEWRTTARRYSLSANELDELEDHLQSVYVARRDRGEAPGEAFAFALRSLGGLGEVSREYRKVRRLTWHRLLEAGWIAFAAAYLLPVVDGGITLLEPNLSEGLLPGFQAIRVAMEEGGWYAVSALTNVLLLRTMWRADDLGRIPSLLLGVALSASTLLNCVWLMEMDAISELRIGYYLWWGSFGLASSALLLRARELGRLSASSEIAS